MPAPVNWVRFRLLLIAIGLQSLVDENLFYASISSLSARNGKSWSTCRWLVVDLLSRWTGFDPGSSELFLSLSCCRKKNFLFLFPFCPRETSSPIRIFFGILRGSNAGADKIIYQIFELCNFSKSGLFERAQVQMPLSPGSGFDARELLGLFLNVIERR